MNKLTKQALAVGALLASSVSYGATVTFTLSENSGIANDGLVNIGDSFSILMKGQGFPNTGGASLGLTFNNVATINSPSSTVGIVVAAGSPFAPGVLTDAPSFLSGMHFTFLAPLTGALPVGNFDTVVFNYTATAKGLLNLQIFDDQVDNSFTNGDTFEAIPVTYNYTGAFVQVIPVPAAAWLFVSAIGGLATLKRRQAA